MAQRDKILFISSHTPAPNAPEAGHKLAWRNIERLAIDGDVDVLLVTNKSEVANVPVQWPSYARLIEVVAVSRLDKALAVIRWAQKWSPRFAARLTPRAITAIKGAIAATRYDRVWLEFAECGGFLEWIPADMPTTVSAPDVLTQWALRKRGIVRYLAGSIFADELFVYSRANHVQVPSAKDADLIRALFSIERVSVETPPLSSFVSGLVRNAGTITPKSLLFWGAMARDENSRAILRFLDVHWPRILARHPDAYLYIVGSNPPHSVESRASERVVVTGFLEDPSPYFVRAAVGIAPLMEGAGVKVKVLEMLAAGIPVISTPIGAEGVPVSADLHVCNFDQLATTVFRLFEN